MGTIPVNLKGGREGRRPDSPSALIFGPGRSGRGFNESWKSHGSVAWLLLQSIMKRTSSHLAVACITSDEKLDATPRQSAGWLKAL